ncbi:MAG: amidohydrolase family protein [Fimbriimonadaceae bacterium]|nr:amidohydrolase family protein [Fimbriimonadaceae bacterium]
MILRPRAIVRDGELFEGLEVEYAEGVVRDVRPFRGTPDGTILSPAFVNAHSHLEYRGLQGVVPARDYWTWIRELTRLKTLQVPAQVREDAHLAARENRAAGVGYVAEHSDLPVAGEAMRAAGLMGIVFQEVITFNERDDPDSKWRLVEERAAINRAAFGGPVVPSPHAPYTVDQVTLRRWADAPQNSPLFRASIHVAETSFESAFFRDGDGPIADFYRRQGAPFEATGLRVVAWLDALGLVRPGMQFVHACAVEAEDVGLLARRRVSVAHCPRSNEALGCPVAPVRRMLDAGVRVGLGLDSAASSGPIDVFAEMRAAVRSAIALGEPLDEREVWHMATTGGAASLGIEDWRIAPDARVPLLRLPDRPSLAALIRDGSPDDAVWL